MCAHNNDTYALLHGENLYQKLLCTVVIAEHEAADQKFLLCPTCNIINIIKIFLISL